MTEAFPWDTAPRYLLRDRDTSYGPVFRDRVQVLGIEEVVTAPRTPWENPYVERLIGSVRRECLDHIIIFNERHLHHVLSRYFQYHDTPDGALRFQCISHELQMPNALIGTSIIFSHDQPTPGSQPNTFLSKDRRQ
jgi:hypothetical protein